MHRYLLIVLFTLFANSCFAQTDKDLIVDHLPLVNGKLIYSDSVFVKGRNKAALDSTSKKWARSYFKELTICAPPMGKDTLSSVLNQGLFGFDIKPGYMNIPLKAVLSIQITCNDKGYSYKISDIYFKAANNWKGMFVSYSDPEFLIKIYRRDHVGILDKMNISKKAIKEYLFKMDLAVKDCIASLNTAMAN